MVYENDGRTLYRIRCSYIEMVLGFAVHRVHMQQRDFRTKSIPSGLTAPYLLCIHQSYNGANDELSRKIIHLCRNVTSRRAAAYSSGTAFSGNAIPQCQNTSSS